MISTNDFRTGVTVELDNAVWSVVEFQHVKPGKGSAFVRTKLKNLETGAVVERTFRAGEKLPRAHLDRREVQYLYSAGNEYTFMDTQTFDQFTLTEEQVGDQKKFLLENMTLYLIYHNGRLIGVELPNSVELKVVKADPGLRGDTASGGSKPVTLETGLVIQVPLFIEEGDVVRVDTRTGLYIERA
ncbi:MAG: elongation factor P [Firmicutes bacterium]|nr:elongation factor P [Bacillota bacterium]